MKTISFLKFLASKTFCLLVVFGFALTSCKKGSVSGSAGSAALSGNIGVIKVFPTSEGPNWNAITTTAPLRYFIKGMSLSLTGTCSPGISYVKVNAGSGYFSEQGYCDLAGTYSWSRTFLAADFPSNPSLEDDFSMLVDGFDINNVAVAGASANVNVRLDSVAPNTPSYINPNSATYIHPGSTGAFQFSISSSIDSDVVRISRAGLNQVMTFNTGLNRWDYNDTLVLGTSTIYNFSAVDKAGNISPPLTTTMIWTPSLTAPLIGAYAAGDQNVFFDGPGAADYLLSGTLDELSDTSISTGPPLRYLDLSFNKIVKELKGQ